MTVPLLPFPPLLALESIRDAFYVVDAQWRIVFFNAAAERHFGCSREDMLGRTVYEVFAAASRSPFDPPFREAMRTRTAARIEAESVRGDGRWVEVEATPCGDGLCVQVRDITARKQVELQLRERESELAEADRRKDEFLAVLSHELRNPLAPLTNVLRLLERSARIGDDERDLIAVAERQRARLMGLVDDLLEIARASRDKITLRLEPTPIANLVRDATESVGPDVAVRGQRLAIELPVSTVRLVCDPARIVQVLENLLHNASKYTPDGGSIRIAAHVVDDSVEIEVSDDGIGIASSDLERIFEPFTQLEPAAVRASGGLGIGLALVRRLVELHGGSVAVFSEGLGRGARFTVRLPRSHPGV
jgi:PAS domain S-box-containing protein